MINYLFMVVLVLIALTSLPLWWMAIQRVRGSTSGPSSNALLPPRQQIESPIGLFDVLLTFLFWIRASGRVCVVHSAGDGCVSGRLGESDCGPIDIPVCRHGSRPVADDLVDPGLDRFAVSPSVPDFSAVHRVSLPPM